MCYRDGGLFIRLRRIRRGLSTDSWKATRSLALVCLRVLAILASCGAAAETISPEDPLAQWTRRSPYPHGTEMPAITFGGGLWRCNHDVLKPPMNRSRAFRLLIGKSPWKRLLDHSSYSKT